MAHETTPTPSRASAAFQNRFLAQDIVHDREMASRRPREERGRGRHAVHLKGDPFGLKYDISLAVKL